MIDFMLFNLGALGSSVIMLPSSIVFFVMYFRRTKPLSTFIKIVAWVLIVFSTVLSVAISWWLIEAFL